MYKKLTASLKERIIFLFTGLLDTKYLIVKETNKPVLDKREETKVDINTTEEEDLKMDIPFFDLDQSKTKSNL